MLAPIFPKSTQLTMQSPDFMLMGLCLWSRFGSFFGCWLTKVSGYNLDKGRHHVFVESLLKDWLFACSISSMASSALDQDFLALAGKKSMRGARQRLEFVMSFGIKGEECTGRLLLEEDSSVEDKSTVEPPTLCWLISGLVAEN